MGICSRHSHTYTEPVAKTWADLTQCAFCSPWPRLKLNLKLFNASILIPTEELIILIQ